GREVAIHRVAVAEAEPGAFAVVEAEAARAGWGAARDVERVPRFGARAGVEHEEARLGGRGVGGAPEDEEPRLGLVPGGAAIATAGRALAGDQGPGGGIGSRGERPGVAGCVDRIARD